jgi:hypothetical protein
MSSHLDIALTVVVDSGCAALTGVPHRFGERTCPRVHVSLRRYDVRVTGEHLQFMHRDAIIRETRERIVTKIVPVKVDPIPTARAESARSRVRAAPSHIERSIAPGHSARPPHKV